MTWELPVIESVQERLDRDSLSSLTDAERTYYCVWSLLNAAYGPGLMQYLEAAGRTEIDCALAGLSELGCDAIRSDVEAALSLLPRGYFDSRPGSKGRSVSESIEESIYQASSRLDERPYPQKELEGFVQANEAAFLGPRSQLDMWRSKSARGAITAPRFVAKVFDRESEAEKDRAFSSRPCPQCGYPSPDYRSTCKACGYPHGKKG